jgi:hypothetical protein
VFCIDCKIVTLLESYIRKNIGLVNALGFWNINVVERCRQMVSSNDSFLFLEGIWWI